MKLTKNTRFSLMNSKSFIFHKGLKRTGVSEVMDDSGVELGDTELYLNTVRNSAHKSAHHFINDIADLVMEYNGDKKLRDDVTMLVAKIEE